MSKCHKSTCRHPNCTSTIWKLTLKVFIFQLRKFLFVKKQTWTFQERIQLSHSRPLKLWTTPIALHNSPYMPLTHWFPSRGPKPISLVFRHSPCLNLQWPSKTFIHPPRMTMTDLATKQSICIPLSLSPSFSLSCFLFSFSPSLHSLAILLMCRIWWKSESADRFDTVACESNNAITIWPWRTTNSRVHLSVFLTCVTFHFQRKPTNPSCKHTIIILYLQGFDFAG